MIAGQLAGNNLLKKELYFVLTLKNENGTIFKVLLSNTT